VRRLFYPKNLTETYLLNFFETYYCIVYNFHCITHAYE